MPRARLFAQCLVQTHDIVSLRINVDNLLAVDDHLVHDAPASLDMSGAFADCDRERSGNDLVAVARDAQEINLTVQHQLQADQRAGIDVRRLAALVAQIEGVGQQADPRPVRVLLLLGADQDPAGDMVPVQGIVARCQDQFADRSIGRAR